MSLVAGMCISRNAASSIGSSGLIFLLYFLMLPLLAAPSGAQSQSAESPQKPRATKGFRTLAKGIFSAFREPKRELIKDKSEFEKAWAQCSARDESRTKIPDVDFETEMVLLVAMGQQRTGGYAIEITAVTPTQDRVRVALKTKEPAPGGITIQALTAPFHMVAVPRSELKLEFITQSADE